VEALHREHPGLSSEVSIKVEHLLKHASRLPELRETGTKAARALTYAPCLIDAGVGSFPRAHLCTFHPWTPLEGYEDLLTHNNKDEGRWNKSRPSNSPPGALIPTGLCLPQVLARHNAAIAPFGQEALSYPGANLDLRVDRLQRDLEAMMGRSAKSGGSRTGIFEDAWKLLGSS
jgi:hypothetical protein